MPSPARVPMRLVIASEIVQTIHAHLRRAYPDEGCGVLLGRELADGREVVEAIGFANAREDSRANRYLIAPEELLAAEWQGRERGLDVIGFFHSHPDHPAAPSRFDLEHAWPYYSYLIVSVTQAAIVASTSWRLADDRSRFEPETIEHPQ